MFATHDFFVDPPVGEASNIFTISPDGTDQQQLTHLGFGTERAAQPTFTPDGECVLFTYEKAAARRAAFVAVGGGPIRLVPEVFATHPRSSLVTETPCAID